MRLCLIASAHSVHVRTWLKYFVASEHEVTLITPDKCLYEIPGVTLLNVSDYTTSDRLRRALRDLRLLRKVLHVRQRVGTEWRHRTRSGESIVRRADARIRATDAAEREAWNAAVVELSPVVDRMVSRLKPDVVQSLRFYPEGLISDQVDHPRRCVFVWGSDISGFGTWYPEVGDGMRVALSRCAALMTDNEKDHCWATRFGLPATTPHLLVPSNGGIDTRQMPPALADDTAEPRFATFRRMGNLFMNNAPILRAIALLRERGIEATYSLYGNEYGDYYDKYRVLAQELGIWKYIKFERPFRAESVFDSVSQYRLQVSPAIDDGTSNALLETMWLGGVPIYSDLPSIREWITDGENGYLFDMDDPKQIASQFERAWRERPLHPRMATINQDLVRQRGDYTTNMRRVEEFYWSLM